MIYLVVYATSAAHGHDVTITCTTDRDCTCTNDRDGGFNYSGTSNMGPSSWKGLAWS